MSFEQATPGSGKGLTIGFIQLDLSSPFPQAVEKSVQQQADRAGAQLVTCDSKNDATKALNCAKLFKTRGVDGMIIFQKDANSAPAICAAGPQVPVVAMDIEQKPCQTAFMGADNDYAGELAGYRLGMYFRQKFDCEYDAYVSIEASIVGQVNAQRMDGMRKGFESVCGTIHNRRTLDLAAPSEAQQRMTDTLTALPGQHHVIVVGINEDVIVGALSAARAQNRTKDLYLGVQNFDPTNCAIYGDPNWVGSTAYFAERYGEIAVPYLIKAIKKQPIPKQLLVKHQFITNDSAKKYYPQFSC